jgi:hypothetical protein
MARKNFLALMLCLQSGVLCAKVSVTPPLNTYYKEVKALLNKYKRPITVLEIGSSSCCYTLPIATDQKYHAQCIALFEGDATSLVQKAQEQKLKNVVILNPRGLPSKHFRTLGRCEHFDVVLVHGMEPRLQKDFSRTINLFSNLGDFLFIEIPKDIKHSTLAPHFKPVASTETHQLYLGHKPKISLDIGRFTQASIPPRKPRYRIKSTFEDKWLHKKHFKSSWIPGINLITFVMLCGIYPNDSTIRSQFGRMKHSIASHNDLVLGNTIIQGTTLVPIDLKDRRGKHTNMYICLNAAIRIFKDTSRLSNPQAWVDHYYKIIKHQERKEHIRKNVTNYEEDKE